LRDPRNALLVRAARLAVQIEPRVIVIENVSGAVAGAHRKYWDEMMRFLRSSGYQATNIVCDASQMGVAQRRRRILAVAWKGRNVDGLEPAETPGGTLRNAIVDINGAPNNKKRPLSPDSRSAKIARYIGQNQKLCNVRSSPRSVHTWDIPEVFGKTTHWERKVLEALLRRRRQKRIRSFGDADPVTANALRHFIGKPVAATLRKLIQKGYVRRVDSGYDLTHTFNGKFRRLPWDEPAPTVDTKFGDPRFFLHPTEDRAFTVRETARIQGFPDDFVFSGPEKAQFEMIGNAVPPPLAKQLAEHFRRQFF
jgi:DNA (cytosine-5)-methyltransferase 1